VTLPSLTEMQAFVDEVSENKVIVKKVEEDVLQPFAGYTYIDDEGIPTIEFSDAVYLNLKGTQSSDHFIKGFLLHELGHLNTKEEKEPHINEYNAHMWAIDKSISLKLKRVTMSLREEILSWSHLSDTECYHKYREASNMYLDKNGFVI
jgi:hypothetical protein